ncbi:MAG: hypothetical protein FWE60_04230 [Oscillospiraceae bacterium]|nr:hypothetical protein [Oscillospiraceae bacterium]
MPCECCKVCKGFPCKCCDDCNKYPCICCKTCEKNPCTCPAPFPQGNITGNAKATAQITLPTGSIISLSGGETVIISDLDDLTLNVGRRVLFLSEISAFFAALNKFLVEDKQ